MASERVQKILAQAGIASRRKAEELIQEGLVTINGKPAKLGDKAEWGADSIKVKGKLLLKPETVTYLAFYKPKAVISMMSDPEGRPTLADFLTSIKTRLFPVGRLDFNSEGLILLTNDGAFSEKLQKRDDIPRVYSVKVKGHPDAEMMARLERGGRIGEMHRARFIKPHSVKVKQELNNKTVIEVVMLGSGAFDIKELFDTRGFLVEKITRTAIGHLTTRGLLPGKFKSLSASQVEALLEQPELGMKRLEFEEAKAAEKKPRGLAERNSKASKIKIIPRPNTGSERRSRGSNKPSSRPSTRPSSGRVIRPVRGR